MRRREFIKNEMKAHVHIEYEGAMNDPWKVGNLFGEGMKAYWDRTAEDFADNGYPDIAHLPKKMRISLTSFTAEGQAREILYGNPPKNK